MHKTFNTELPHGDKNMDVFEWRCMCDDVWLSTQFNIEVQTTPNYTRTLLPLWSDVLAMTQVPDYWTRSHGLLVCATTHFHDLSWSWMSKRRAVLRACLSPLSLTLLCVNCSEDLLALTILHCLCNEYSDDLPVVITPHCLWYENGIYGNQLSATDTNN